MDNISKKRLGELIAIHGFLVLKTLPVTGGDVEINREYVDTLSALEELRMRRESDEK